MFPTTAQNIDYDAIRNAITMQMECYPASTLQDIYKNFFQDAFGPGHLMSTDQDAQERMQKYLERECEIAQNDSIANTCPDYEQTGWRGQFYRVNLSVINDGRVPLDTFLEAFMQSARTYTLPDLNEWREEWHIILNEVKEMYSNIPNLNADAEQIDSILAQGHYAIHHSTIYNQQYHPHYRLIESHIFQKQILPLLDKREKR